MGIVLQQSLILLSVIFLASAAIPWFLFLLPPFAYVFFRLARYFRSLSRELKRVEGITRSPIYASLQETLAGVVSIRAYNAVDMLTKHNLYLIGGNTYAYMYAYLMYISLPSFVLVS